MKQSKETIRGYFQTGDKPKQGEYFDTWDSFWHKDEVIPGENIDNSISLASTNTTSINALASHRSGMNDIDSVSNITVTIQESATEAIPVGSVLTYNQINDGKITVAYSGSANGDAVQTYKKGDVLTLWHKSLDRWVVLNQPHALDSTTYGEPVGSNQVFNMVSLTQAEYDAGTPVATTLYNIIDA